MSDGMILSLIFGIPAAILAMLVVATNLRKLRDGVYYDFYIYRVLKRKTDTGQIRYLVARSLIFIPSDDYYVGGRVRWTIYMDGSNTFGGTNWPPAKRFQTVEEAAEQLSNLIDQVEPIRIDTA